MLTVLNVSPKQTAKGTTIFTGILEGHGLITGFAKAPVSTGDIVPANYSQGRDGRWAAFVGF